MPNGVICGGAVDGSNQAGDTVTWNASTKVSGPGAASSAGARNTAGAAASEAMTARRDTRFRGRPMRLPPVRSILNWTAASDAQPRPVKPKEEVACPPGERRRGTDLCRFHDVAVAQIAASY